MMTSAGHAYFVVPTDGAGTEYTNYEDHGAWGQSGPLYFRHGSICDMISSDQPGRPYDIEGQYAMNTWWWGPNCMGTSSLRPAINRFSSMRVWR